MATEKEMALKPARHRSGVALRARNGLTLSMIGLSEKPRAGFLTRNPKLKGIMWSHLTAEALNSAETAEMETKKISRNRIHLPVLAFRSKNTQRTQRFSGKPSVHTTLNFGFRTQNTETAASFGGPFVFSPKTFAGEWSMAMGSVLLAPDRGRSA